MKVGIESGGRDAQYRQEIPALETYSSISFAVTLGESSMLSSNSVLIPREIGTVVSTISTPGVNRFWTASRGTDPNTEGEEVDGVFCRWPSSWRIC